MTSCSQSTIYIVQLGLGDTLKRTRPVQVSSLANVSVMSVVCGQYHCIVLDEEHRCDGLMGSNRGPVGG